MVGGAEKLLRVKRLLRGRTLRGPSARNHGSWGTPSGTGSTAAPIANVSGIYRRLETQTRLDHRSPTKPPFPWG